MRAQDEEWWRRLWGRAGGRGRVGEAERGTQKEQGEGQAVLGGGWLKQVQTRAHGQGQGWRGARVNQQQGNEEARRQGTREEGAQARAVPSLSQGRMEAEDGVRERVRGRRRARVGLVQR